MVKPPGRLQVVATPIGNLADLSARARTVLESADLIAAEDTRHTAALLRACGITKPLISLHEHNESGRVPELLARLAAGETIALVSDAGAPLLSDPGYELVRRAAAAGVSVQAVPGPSAVTAALTVPLVLPRRNTGPLDLLEPVHTQPREIFDPLLDDLRAHFEDDLQPRLDGVTVDHRRCSGLKAPGRR